MLDIHSHILPAVDDGAEDLDEALKILEMMQKDGITDVIATPHFYADSDNLNDFKTRTEKAYKTLCSAADGKNLPRVFLGCEVLYYRYIGTSEAVTEFCFNGSNYLLLELVNDCITDSFFENLYCLKNQSGIIPIIAHIERYYKDRSFKKLLKFLKSENIIAFNDPTGKLLALKPDVTHAGKRFFVLFSALLQNSGKAYKKRICNLSGNRCSLCR